jgi:ribosomal protein L11 methyltransferase
MDWLQFVMDLGTLDPDEAEAALLDAGACSVTLTDAGDDPVLEPGPGETPLWSHTQITGLFPGDAEPSSIRQSLRDSLALETLPTHRIESLEDRAWEREWLKDYRPMQFGERLWVCPHGLEVVADDAVVVRLDPGLAFGTGTHPTTALCLEWLDSIDVTGKSVLDYGCGSGVLAIAALKLGAARATGMDIDPQATIATRQNAAENGVSVAVCGSDDEIEGQFDIIVANILAGPLVQFADSITSRLASRGMLALSGVLCEQADEVMTAFDPWIAFDEPVFREQDGQMWSRLTGSRRQGPGNVHTVP